MKVSILQGELLKALSISSKSLLIKANLPILSNILVSANSNKLEVLATNLETATRVVVNCKVQQEGTVAIVGRQFLEYISQLGEGDVTLEKLGEEIVVAQPGYSARFATAQTQEFPAIPKIEKGTTLKLDPAKLAITINKTAFAASLDESRPVLSGVLFSVSGGKATLVSTDGYRLAYDEIGVGDKAASFSVIIPAKSLLEVAKILGESGSLGPDEKKDIDVVFGENLSQVNFKIDGIEFTSRLIEGEFPAWQKIIPNTFVSKAKLSKEEFGKVVKVASIFARESGSIVRLKFENSGKGGGGKLSVMSQTSQVGSSDSAMDVELVGGGGEIAFNFRYLLEALGVMEGEFVTFEMNESLNPGKLTGEATGPYFHIIMPVRLQG